MLLEAGLPKALWAEAVATASYLRNLSPYAGLSMTPHERMSGAKPNVGHLKVFGSTVYVHIPKVKRGKFAPTSWKGTFVGYVDGGLYRVMSDDKLVSVESDVTFDESCMGYQSDSSDSDDYDAEEEENQMDIGESSSEDNGGTPNTHPGKGVPPPAGGAGMPDNEGPGPSDGAQAHTPDSMQIPAGEHRTERYPSRVRQRPQEWWHASPMSPEIAEDLRRVRSRINAAFAELRIDDTEQDEEAGARRTAQGRVHAAVQVPKGAAEPQTYWEA